MLRYHVLRPLALVLAIAPVALPAAACADTVTDWNLLTQQAVTVVASNPNLQTRWGAIGQLVVFKSVNAIEEDRPDEAVAALRDAVAKGYRNLEDLQEREDLAPLRERDDFKMLLEEARTNKK